MLLVKPLMMRFCVKLFFGSKNIQFFSNFNAGNMDKKKGLSVVERVKTVTLNEERCSERQILKKLKFSKTAIHEAIVIFQNFGIFQDLYRSKKAAVTFQKDEHLMKRMVVRSYVSSSKKLD